MRQCARIIANNLLDASLAQGVAPSTTNAVHCRTLLAENAFAVVANFFHQKFRFSIRLLAVAVVVAVAVAVAVGVTAAALATPAKCHFRFASANTAVVVAQHKSVTEVPAQPQRPRIPLLYLSLSHSLFLSPSLCLTHTGVN